jgi:hypothetical protein
MKIIFTQATRPDQYLIHRATWAVVRRRVGVPCAPKSIRQRPVAQLGRREIFSVTGCERDFDYWRKKYAIFLTKTKFPSS